MRKIKKQIEVFIHIYRKEIIEQTLELEKAKQENDFLACIRIENDIKNKGRFSNILDSLSEY